MLGGGLNSKREHLQSSLTSTLMSYTPFVNLQSNLDVNSQFWNNIFILSEINNNFAS